MAVKCKNCGNDMTQHYDEDSNMVSYTCSNCIPKDLDKIVEEHGKKYDVGKIRYSLIPTIATKGLAEVLTFGAEKYGKDNWQMVEDADSRYMDALMRHLEAYRANEKKDPESGKSHLAHVLANASFLMWLDSQRKDW